MAYIAQYSRILNEVMRLPELNNYIETLKKSDAYIFFVRPTKATLKQDGVRETLNWDNIVRIDGILKFLLEMYNLRYFQIDTDSMQERVKLINSVLSLAK